jgi:hypothetical protein
VLSEAAAGAMDNSVVLAETIDNLDNIEIQIYRCISSLFSLYTIKPSPFSVSGAQK